MWVSRTDGVRTDARTTGDMAQPQAAAMAVPLAAKLPKARHRRAHAPQARPRTVGVFMRRRRVKEKTKSLKAM